MLLNDVGQTLKDAAVAAGFVNRMATGKPTALVDADNDGWDHDTATSNEETL